MGADWPQRRCSRTRWDVSSVRPEDYRSLFRCRAGWRAP